MIRDATAADWPEVDRMARAFQAAGGTWVDYSPDVFRATFHGIVVSDQGLAIMPEAGGGILLAMVAPSPFGRQLAAQEIMLWIDPDARSFGLWSHMMAAYEAWGRGKGAGPIGMTVLDERTGTLARRRGYQPAEMVYRLV